MTGTTAPERLSRYGLWLAVLALVLDDLRLRRRVARRDEDVRVLVETLGAQRRAAGEVAAELRHEARTDPLTGLGNRRRWQEQLVHELERARRSGSGLSVAVLDVDDFKSVNDTLGHEAGDRLLREVAERFASSVRAVDLLARVGGEEFAVALPDASPEDAAQIVERVRTSVPPGTTCSAGLAHWDREESLGDLQLRADAAMYRAKAAGRDRLVVG